MEEVKDSAVEEIQENVVKEPQETETTSEAKEAQKAVETQTGIETPEEKNPFLDYMRNAFAKEHIDEFMSTLTDDQKSFIYVFCSGFETAIGRHIVGVYNSEYIEGYHFTKEVLDSLRIVIKPVDVKDSDLKFTIVAQLI